MLHDALYLAGIGTAVVVAMMFVLWMIHLRIANAGIVDIGWAFGLGILGLLYAGLRPADGPRKLMAAVMVAAWSLRLGSYLLVRTVGPPEEGRYLQLRQDWGANAPLKFLVFFEFQALLDVLLSLPFLLACLNPRPGLTALELASAGLWLLAFLGESLADRQLARFKSDPANRGQVCQDGLWNYSRHPNYFFEWMIWAAWAMFAWSSPYGPIAVICPALMLFFLFRITGIPATEAQALRSKGDAYRHYQQTTSAFVPWFKKRTAASTKT